MIINYEPSSRDDDYQHPAILYICGGDACDTDAFHDLKQWRHQQGFIVYTASTYEIGYDTEAIYNAIRNAYDYFDPPPEYVTLVGDVGVGRARHVTRTMCRVASMRRTRHGCRLQGGERGRHLAGPAGRRHARVRDAP